MQFKYLNPFLTLPLQKLTFVPMQIAIRNQQK